LSNAPKKVLPAPGTFRRFTIFTHFVKSKKRSWEILLAAPGDFFNFAVSQFLHILSNQKEILGKFVGSLGGFLKSQMKYKSNIVLSKVLGGFLPRGLFRITNDYLMQL
jgi:hypothetical protein